MAKLVVTGVFCSLLLWTETAGAESVTVAPGKQSDVIVAVSSPEYGDMIDILTRGGPNARVNFFLPDGRELTDNALELEQNGLSLGGFLQGHSEHVKPNVLKFLLQGPGDHLILAFIDKAPEGNYRIQADNRNSTSPFRVEAALVRYVGIRMDSLRRTPGVKIASAVKVPPASTGVKLSLVLTQSTEEAEIDIACTGDRVGIRLRLPDGTVISRENAQANGLEWSEFRYPPDASGGDGFDGVFAAGFLELMSLPVNGMHYQIGFPMGVRKAGTYTVEADGRGSGTTAEVSAMFIPIRSVLKP
jgi:hypothetical protein